MRKWGVQESRGAGSESSPGMRKWGAKRAGSERSLGMRKWGVQESRRACSESSPGMRKWCLGGRAQREARG